MSDKIWGGACAQFNAGSEMADLIFESLILWHVEVWITAIILTEDGMELTLYFNTSARYKFMGSLGITWTND